MQFWCGSGDRPLRSDRPSSRPRANEPPRLPPTGPSGSKLAVLRRPELRETQMDPSPPHSYENRTMTRLRLCSDPSLLPVTQNRLAVIKLYLTHDLLLSNLRKSSALQRSAATPSLSVHSCPGLGLPLPLPRPGFAPAPAPAWVCPCPCPGLGLPLPQPLAWVCPCPGPWSKASHGMDAGLLYMATHLPTHLSFSIVSSTLPSVVVMFSGRSASAQACWDIVPPLCFSKSTFSLPCARTSL